MAPIPVGQGCDVVIEAVGAQWPLDLAAELTGVRARLVIVGYHQDGPRQVSTQGWNWKGLDVINARERDPRIYVRGMKEAVAAAVQGTLPTLELLKRNSAAVEDSATAHLYTADHATLTLQCSWNLHAGRDAVIAARFYGERGTVVFENVDGSFYDFVACLYNGTRATRLVEPPDAWFGRAAVEWARKLRKSRRFDPEAEEHIPVATVLDDMYGR